MEINEKIKYSKSIEQNILDLKIGNNLNGYSLITNSFKNVSINKIVPLKSAEYYLLNGIKFHPNSILLYKNNGIIKELDIITLEEQLKLGNNIKILNFYMEEIEVESFEYLEMPKTKYGNFITIHCDNFSVFVPYSKKQILIKDTLFMYLM
jgi:hypothetical protein